ncbi:hypothetical protein FR932_14980 [Moritella marina ATCC 15381]|uniref:Serine protease n=1 Tax=Moritella marina ATCC 15381 TaxID=1202962 RepID=A0A5J6WLP7_MORMI|nr:hypothetical protein [Moritella marina]QFI39066.1 hypothetical protein FR932_14980 [Moritella marina ATCC 15381]
MRITILTPLLLLSMTACSSTQQEPVGGGRDAHGCLPAAGYQWCDRTQTCERSWELADAANIEHSAAEIKAYCEIIDSDLLSDDDQ